MRKLTLATFALLLACYPVFAAEPDAATDTAANPAEKAPKPEKKSPPQKTEYAKLPHDALQKKADNGDLNAQFELGSRYNYGRDLPKNTREALRWLRMAANGGHAGAQRLLAVKLFEGHDVPVNHEEAFKWAQRLADSGDRPGQLMLGNMYANGEGTPRSLIRAYMWFDIAATPVTGKAPDEAGKMAMENAASARDKTSGLLQPEEEAEAQQLASDWWLGKKVAKAVPAAKKQKSGKSAKGKSSPRK